MRDPSASDLFLLAWGTHCVVPTETMGVDGAWKECAKFDEEEGLSTDLDDGGSLHLSTS